MGMTFKQFKDGKDIPVPIYVHKPYVLLSKENVVLSAGDLEHFKGAFFKTSYYDDCIFDVRQHDLYLNNNARIKH